MPTFPNTFRHILGPDDATLSPPLQGDSTYMYDQSIQQGATGPELAANLQQTRINDKQEQERPLGLTYSPSESELIDLLPSSSHVTYPTTTLTVGQTSVALSKTIRLLGIRIDRKLSFREHTAKATTKTQFALPLIQRLGFTRGHSIQTVHHMTQSLLIPILFWGSKVWWTGARQIVDHFSPTYHRFALLITTLPPRTRTDKLLPASSLPPLEPNLYSVSKRYGLAILGVPDDQPNKSLFRTCTPLAQGVEL